VGFCGEGNEHMVSIKYAVSGLNVELLASQEGLLHGGSCLVGWLVT
jgi:hypothetical protein